MRSKLLHRQFFVDSLLIFVRVVAALLIEIMHTVQSTIFDQ